MTTNYREWCLEAGSNHRHADFQSAALPTELSRQKAFETCVSRVRIKRFFEICVNRFYALICRSLS